MIYKKLLVYTDNIEAASGILIMLGAAGTEVISQSEDDLLCFNFDYIDIEKPTKTAVAAYFEDGCAISGVADTDTDKCVALGDVVAELEKFGFRDIEVSEIDTASYEDEWKKYLKPVELSRFWIVPLIEGDAEDGTDVSVPKDSVSKERIEIVPGRAFGTGMHETTKLCIEMLTKYLKPGAVVADIGTGSAILAIAAKKLGAGTVYGVDNDLDALENAKLNARLNSVEVRLDCADLASTISGKVDIVVANIAVRAVIELADTARRLLMPGGIYICSGIILSEKKRVQDELVRLGYELVESPEIGEWCAVVAKRGEDKYCGGGNTL